MLLQISSTRYNNGQVTMNPHKRLFGYCANRRHIAASKYEVIAETGRLLRTLILFDHFTLHSLRLREFKGFVSDLGIEATLGILNSKALRIFPDFVIFVVPDNGEGHAYRSNAISIARIAGQRQHSLDAYLSDLRQSMANSCPQFDKLEEAIRNAMAPLIHNYGQEAEESTYRDMVANPEALKIAVASQLKRSHRFAIKAKDFDLQMHPVGHAAYRAETNLHQLCRFTEQQVNGEISMAMTALAHLNLRVEEMQAHSSITGFDDDDLSMFENRIRFLLDRHNARDQEAAFQRVISLLSIPQIPTGHFDVESFLALRQSSECAEFRRWLSETADWSDREIVDHIKSLHQAGARFYQGFTGQTFRVLASIGLGIASPLVGPLFTAVDTFLLDKILKPSGAITFIASEYPSLFESAH